MLTKKAPGLAAEMIGSVAMQFGGVAKGIKDTINGAKSVGSGVSIASRGAARGVAAAGRGATALYNQPQNDGHDKGLGVKVLELLQKSGSGSITRSK